MLKYGSITDEGKIVNYGDITKDFDDSYNIAKHKDTESSKLTKEVILHIDQVMLKNKMKI